MKFFASSVILLSAFVLSQAKEAPCTGSACTTAKPTTTINVVANKTATLTNDKNLKANDTLTNRLNTAAIDCKKELNAQQEMMAMLSSGALPTNEKQRCFIECVYNKIGLMKEGKLNEEGATNLAKQKFGENKELMAKADALFKKCKTEAVIEKDSKEKCALGRLIRTCIANHGKEVRNYNRLDVYLLIKKPEFVKSSLSQVLQS